MTNSKLVPYPIFLGCKKYTLDEYWKQTFDKCSVNRFPKKCYYNNSTHSIHVGAKGSSVKYTLPEDPEKLCNSLINIFREELKEYSPNDIQIGNKELEDIRKMSYSEADDWKSLKPHIKKENAILRYIVEFQEEYKLSDDEAITLKAIIETGIRSKKILPEHIDYSSGKIQSISGLEYVDGKFVITNKAKSTSKSEKAPPVHKFFQAVEKYYIEYKKQKLHI